MKTINNKLYKLFNVVNNGTKKPFMIGECLDYFTKTNYQIYEIALKIDDIPNYDVQFKERF